jgi:hypothetical protein
LENRKINVFGLIAGGLAGTASLSLSPYFKTNEYATPQTAIYSSASSATNELTNIMKDFETQPYRRMLSLAYIDNNNRQMDNQTSKSVKNYISLTSNEDFITAYNKEIKTLEYFYDIRNSNDYANWFKEFESLSKCSPIAITTMLFSIAQIDFAQLVEEERLFAVNALNNQDINVSYYALIAIENWNNKDLNKIAKSKHYANDYLQAVASNLEA